MCAVGFQEHVAALAEAAPFGSGYPFVVKEWPQVWTTGHCLECCGWCAQGIGLPLEEALKFWKAEFAPKTTAEKFDKEYAYQVRHNYAKEGKRTDYTPYSCKKIITTPVPKVCQPPSLCR